jgi:hypothetical protein
MEFDKFLTAIIEKGIKACKRDYKRADQKSILKGSIAGFEACRGKNTIELSQLLDEARRKSQDHFLNTERTKKDVDKHWELRGFALEVEWVCNVASCALYNQGLPTIIPPTVRGMMTASEILGVKGVNQ